VNGGLCEEREKEMGLSTEERVRAEGKNLEEGIGPQGSFSKVFLTKM